MGNDIEIDSHAEKVVLWRQRVPQAPLTALQEPNRMEATGRATDVLDAGDQAKGNRSHVPRGGATPAPSRALGREM